MHAYVITAKPNRWQRMVRAIARRVPRLLVGTGMVLLGVLVFAVRTVRALANLIAYVAARFEFWAAEHAGWQPVGQAIGVGVTDAFVTEFHRGWVEDPAA